MPKTKLTPDSELFEIARTKISEAFKALDEIRCKSFENRQFEAELDFEQTRAMMTSLGYALLNLQVEYNVQATLRFRDRERYYVAIRGKFNHELNTHSEGPFHSTETAERRRDMKNKSETAAHEKRPHHTAQEWVIYGYDFKKKSHRIIEQE